MGNWKTKYRVSDLSDTQKLEMICKKCSRLVYINKATICTAKGANNSIWMRSRSVPDAKLEAAKVRCGWPWFGRMKCPASQEGWHDANFTQLKSS